MMEALPSDADQNGSPEPVAAAETSIVFPPHHAYLADLRHYPLEVLSSFGPADNGLVSKWKIKDRMKTSWVALVVCLNIGVDPPDVIKVSPCARMECWIDPSSMPQKALDAIGKNLQSQYQSWSRAKYKLALDPTVEEVKKVCSQCRKSAKSERVLFHYNGHGVPKPTMNGELWFFNKSYTQYIPLSVYELESWLGEPSIYVFDCSGAGVVVNAFIERPEWALGSSSMSSKDCILLAACGATEVLPQNSGFPADLFTSCLTTPIKTALRWFISRSLLGDAIKPDMIDKIPGLQNDRNTLLGELNWIFTAITDTIAWNVLPRDLFQRLFRQDLLVASLFRNFLLAERIMRSANCSPACYPCLPLTHQHPMWYAWDMAAETCLQQLQGLLDDPNAEFQPSPFFTQQLTAFEVWLEHGSESKRPPEQLPIVLQVLLRQSYRRRALILLGRFLDMGAWAVDLALSVGIFPYVLKLLQQTTAPELRPILAFIWVKILEHDKSCQVDLVKDGGHQYFIRFLDSSDADQQAMAAFVLTVINDGHPRGQLECFQSGLIDICLRHIAPARGEPLLMRWLCLCLGKMWDGIPKAQLSALQSNVFSTLAQLLSEPQPEVRAATAFALGTLINSKSDNDEDNDDEEARLRMEQEVMKTLLKVINDGSPLVRAELAIALARLTVRHNRCLRSAAAAYLKPPSNIALAGLGSSAGGVPGSSHFFFSGKAGSSEQHKVDRTEGIFGKTFAIRSPVVMNSRATASAPASPSEDVTFVENEFTNGVMRQVEETAVYVRSVAAAYSLVRDPCPWVADLGQEVLRRIGVEAVIMQAKPLLKFGTATTGFPRSASWVDNNLGSLAAKASASPPTGSSLLSGTPVGMRRVPSLEFSSKSVPAKLHRFKSASMDTAEQGPGLNSHVELPQSVLYRWSCGHFVRSLLGTANDEEEEACVLREERERMALDGISKCQRLTIAKVTDQIASWDTESEVGTKAILLHPFRPLACTADEKEIIRIWSYDENQDEVSLMNEFENHEGPDRGISRLCLINELDDSLLLVASSDGSIRVWRNYSQDKQQQLATAWHAIQGHRPGARGISAVVDWQQLTGYLYASGDISSIVIWDVDKESVAFRLPSHSDSRVSALSASHVHRGLSMAGCANGSLMMFDQDKLIFSSKAHSQRIVGVNFVQSGIDTTKVVSASQAGDIKIFDVRKMESPVVSVEAHKGHLTSLAVHRHAPVFASGSAKRCIKVFSASSGEQLSMIRFHNSFLAQRIGPVSCLSFHPYSLLLAAGATDSMVSIYAGDGTGAR